MRGDDEFDSGGPVRVEHDHGVIVQDLEDLLPQPSQAVYQRRVVAVVQRAASGLGEHDCGDMRQ